MSRSLLLLLGMTHGLNAWVITQDDVAEEPRVWDVECGRYARFSEGCHTRSCKRILEDNFVTREQASQLIAIAQLGISLRPPTAGPTIVDINTGFIRDMNGLINMYRGRDALRFEDADYELYRTTIDRIRRRIMHHFGLDHLYFTAPTFITQLVGDENWSPKSIHDEYWHVHVDRNNTPHYDYSGLLYLNDYGTDFEGGEFYFYDEEPDEGREVPSDTLHMVQPRAGRMMAFSSGTENTHRVSLATSGTRYVIAMWFTCDKRREFSAFLDGRPHDRFQNAGTSGSKRRRRRGKRRPKPASKDEL